MPRRVLAWLLCLMLPWQAWAQPPLPPQPCPMEAEMAALMTAALADGSAHELALDDCCHDAETFARTGQACHADGDCHASSPALLPGADAAPAGLPSASAEVLPAAPPPPGADAPIWRPPTLR